MIEQENIVGKIITIPIEKMDLPDEIYKIVDVELLQWLISKNLSQAIVDSITICKIQVTRKPRTKKERYIVTGGIIPFLILLRCRQIDSIAVILVDESTANFPTLINDDLMLWLLAFRAGAIANGGRAVLLTELMRNREETGQSEGLVISYNQLGKGRLLKEFTGFDSRGFRREKINPIPPALEKICSALGVKHDAVLLRESVQDEGET